ncbi:MFS transporter [Kosakonia oryzae]|uniref:MFS transporter n=1 Tax=Kosakonia oryzae TaxID=497725 RepID=A0AA94H2Y3_9ENTR|nr:MFS transporter [Kosakonia oryzae]ANI82647.1 MFS transporter [Kosakonia oryzae]UDJ84565.1 MFS transporter [Kosakonia oryzae]SFC25608.1 MFS transporter, ACS family, glucarate transporter [Kosakonia oryzae]
MSQVNNLEGVLHAKKTNVRWHIVIILFIITAVSVGDRSTLAIAGKDMSAALGINPGQMGWVFSSFAWAYCLAQIPGGWLLDRFGSKKVYLCGLCMWSIFTLLQGCVEIFHGFGAIICFTILLFLVGLFEAPVMPGNSRFVAAWFPSKERATAAAIFNSAQYFATAIFAPIMGWLTLNYGWQSIFIFMGTLGIVITFAAAKVVHNPLNHPRVNSEEIEYIRQGGALVDMDQSKIKTGPTFDFSAFKQLITNRMLLGVYLGQYCINVLTFFFITWFPLYLAMEKGLDIKTVGFIAAIPAICGFLGGLTGGVISDRILRITQSLSIARKTPIVLGMLLSMVMVFCNYVDSIYLVVFFMSLAFLGKGIGALGWAVMSDTAPKEMAGVAGGFFNLCGNFAGIISPVVIGYIVKATGHFEWALVFVAVHALIAIFSFVVIVGPIKRIELNKVKAQ